VHDADWIILFRSYKTLDYSLESCMNEKE